jgi:hypothetical protein
MSGLRALVAATAILATVGILTSCAVGPGYGGEGYVGVGYAGDYYDPCCYDYGGWGGRYHVGPPRGGGGPRPGVGRPSPGGGGHGGGGRPAPSIPGRPR